MSILDSGLPHTTNTIIDKIINDSPSATIIIIVVVTVVGGLAIIGVTVLIVFKCCFKKVNIIKMENEHKLTRDLHQ